MTTEITKELMCISMRNGIKIWIEKEKAEKLITLLEQKKEKGFVSLEGRFINVADVVGIFPATDIEEYTHLQNKDWKDSKGNWQKYGMKECACGNILPFSSKCGYCAR